MSAPSYDVQDTLKLVLLFHEDGPWDEVGRMEWLRITGSSKATKKVLCDHIRAVIALEYAKD